MKVRVLEAQTDLFEVGILSQTAEVQAVSVEQLLAAPSGAPVVIIGGLLAADHLSYLRTLSSVLGPAGAPVIIVPPFTDLDLGRYFETPVKLRAHRRGAESAARIMDVGSAEAVGNDVKIRSDHFFETALGAGIVAVDAQGKPVLIRYQATNTSAPVFFSALQLLTYTALTDEAQRQNLLTRLLSWAPIAVSEVTAEFPRSSVPPTADTVSEGVLVPVALLLAAGGHQTEEQTCARAKTLLGVNLSGDDIRQAVEELCRQGLLTTEGAASDSRAALGRFLEQRGMHPYLRELEDLLASEETIP